MSKTTFEVTYKHQGEMTRSEAYRLAYQQALKRVQKVLGERVLQVIPRSIAVYTPMSDRIPYVDERYGGIVERFGCLYQVVDREYGLETVYIVPIVIQLPAQWSTDEFDVTVEYSVISRIREVLYVESGSELVECNPRYGPVKGPLSASRRNPGIVGEDTVLLFPHQPIGSVVASVPTAWEGPVARSESARSGPARTAAPPPESRPRASIARRLVQQAVPGRRSEIRRTDVPDHRI